MTLIRQTSDRDMPVIPRCLDRIVADGRHNAFAAFARWRGRYWLAFRKGSGHTARDGEMVVLASSDARAWAEVTRFSAGDDDRDAQFLVTEDRLRLYFNTLTDGLFTIAVSHTDDGSRWSAPQRVYRDGFILWKPVEQDGRFYAGAHRPGAASYRLAYLVVSDDGVAWERVSSIREGRGESETALLFDAAGHLTAFLRDQTRIGGAIMESVPPYTQWSERPAEVHLSGHSVCVHDGVVYLFSRQFACDLPVEAAAPRSALPEAVDQGTIVYTYEGGALAPYCLLGPLADNHDSSYATAVREGDEMLVVFHRSEHEYAGPYRAEDAADLYLARVPLKRE